MIKANQELAAMLQLKREKSGLTLKQIAKRLRITPEYLRHLERGGRPVHISPRLGTAIVALYGCHPVYFWTLVSDQNRRTKRYYRQF